MMKSLVDSVSFGLLTGLLTLPAAAPFADTLELRDGRQLEGQYAGGSSKMLHFQSEGKVSHIPLHAVRALRFSERDTATPSAQAEPTRTIIAPVEGGADAMTIQRVPAAKTESQPR